ncbi:MAG: hypothetical protein P1V81_01165 [Planctomycetota bacterium]|nr:hypothetical protein [Planctomycetota bacterium]
MKPFKNAPVLLSGLCLTLAACSGDDSGVATFSPMQTQQAALTSFTPVVTGDWAIYRADEATTGAGTDLDGDTDTDGVVTFAVSLLNGVQHSANLQADEAHLIGSDAWLVVDEAKTGIDHNGVGGAVDVVLMHWVVDSEVDPVYVADVAIGGNLTAVAVDERMYFATPASTGAGTTNLAFVDTTAPATPVVVAGPGGGLDSGRIHGERDGLLLLTFDENTDGDLDGDADGTDSFVLGLLDGTDVAAMVSLTSLGLRNTSAPFDAEILDVAGDGTPDEGWLIAVLVDEAAEGADLNDPALFHANWLPAQCGAAADGDQIDEVLHYLYFGHPTFGTGAVNTGLVGRNKALVVDGEYVATISPEDEQGCDLNQEGLAGDLFARWCEAVDPALGSMGVFPPTAATLMDALVAGPAGGSFGLVKLDGKLVALVDELTDDQDHDGDGAKTSRLLAFVEDLGSDMAWDYDLIDPSLGPKKVRVDWMAAEPEIDRLGVGVSEAQEDLNLNLGCSGVQMKDADKTDQVLGWLHFETAGLVAYGLGFAADPFNNGTTLAGGNIYFRLDEAGDNVDFNGDGDKNDVALSRFALGVASCASFMSTLNGDVGPALFSDNQRGAVFFFDEAMANIDANGDGDKTDDVLRWFRFF